MITLMTPSNIILYKSTQYNHNKPSSKTSKLMNQKYHHKDQLFCCARCIDNKNKSIQTPTFSIFTGEKSKYLDESILIERITSNICIKLTNKGNDEGPNLCISIVTLFTILLQVHHTHFVVSLSDFEK